MIPRVCFQADGGVERNTHSLKRNKGEKKNLVEKKKKKKKKIQIEIKKLKQHAKNKICHKTKDYISAWEL
jgi:hypothetical protein